MTDFLIYELLSSNLYCISLYTWWLISSYIWWSLIVKIYLFDLNLWESRCLKKMLSFKKACKDNFFQGLGLSTWEYFVPFEGSKHCRSLIHQFPILSLTKLILSLMPMLNIYTNSSSTFYVCLPFTLHLRESLVEEEWWWIMNWIFLLLFVGSAMYWKYVSLRI